MKKLSIAALGAVLAMNAFGQASKTNPKLMPFKNEVVACEQRLAKKYGDMAVKSAEAAEKAKAKLSSAETSDPEYAALEKRLSACAKDAAVVTAGAAAEGPLRALEADVTACEQRVAKGDGASARTAAESGGRSKDRVPAGAQSGEQYSGLVSRLEACAGKATSLAAAAEGGARGKETAFFALGDSEQGRVLLDDLSASGVDPNNESNRSKASKAVSYYQACVKKLDEAFAGAPDVKAHELSRPSGNVTAGKLRDECAAKVATAEGFLAKAKAEEAAGAKAKLQKIYKDQWSTITGNLTAAQKLLASKDPLALVDADGKLYYYEHDLGLPMHLDAAKSALDAAPELAGFELSKGLTAKAFVEKTDAIRAEAVAERNKIRNEVRGALAKYDAEVKKVVKGDRLEVIQKHGRPSWVEGANGISNVRAGVNHHAKAAFFRYDSSNGCKTYYYFNGSDLSKTEYEPKGCRP